MRHKNGLFRKRLQSGVPPHDHPAKRNEAVQSVPFRRDSSPSLPAQLHPDRFQRGVFVETVDRQIPPEPRLLHAAERQFHAAGCANGGRSCEDPPGVREGPGGKLYLAYLRDPDGNKICALHRVPKQA